MHLSTGQLQMDTTLWFRRICVWQPITLTSQAYQSEDAPYPVLNPANLFADDAEESGKALGRWLPSIHF